MILFSASRRNVILGTITCLVLFFFAFLTSTMAAEPVKIGMLVDQTGFFSWYGQKTLQAANLVVDRANKDGGVNGRPVELVVYNTQSQAERAIQGARNLIEDEQVDALFGLGHIGATKAVEPLIERNGGPVLYTSCGAYFASPPGNKYMFAGQAYTADVTRKTLRALEDQGLTRVALLSTNNATGQNALEVTQNYVSQPESKITLVGKELFNTETVDLTAHLTTLRAKQPEVLFAWVIGKHMGIVVNNYRQLGMDIPVVSIHANIVPQFLDSLKEYQPDPFFIPATKDIVWEDLPSDDPVRSVNANFQPQFEERYGEWSGLGGGTGHDGISLLIEAMREVGTNPDDMTQYIESRDQWVGAVGTYNFSKDDHRGLGLDDIVLTRVVNGKLEMTR